MKSLNWIKGLALCAALAAGTGAATAAPTRVFAAASLQGPLDAVAANFASDVVISYAGSGTIARQVALGAPVDAIILANSLWADWLVDQGHAQPAPRDMLSNRLILIGPVGALPLPAPDADTLRDRLGDGRLAMGQHMSVPAGIYAQAWLAGIGAWDALRPHLAETENVRAALTLVARGEAPLGIVYASDAAATDAVSVLWTVPTDQHPPIHYPGLSFTGAGVAFLDHVMTQRDTFVAAGFTLP